MNTSQHESDSGYRYENDFQHYIMPKLLLSSCSPTLASMSDQGDQNNTLTHSAMDSYAGPDIAPFDPEDSGEQFEDSEFRPATEVFSGGDLDILQQHGTQSSSVSHLARYGRPV